MKPYSILTLLNDRRLEEARAIFPLLPRMFDARDAREFQHAERVTLLSIFLDCVCCPWDKGEPLDVDFDGRSHGLLELVKVIVKLRSGRSPIDHPVGECKAWDRDGQLSSRLN